MLVARRRRDGVCRHLTSVEKPRERGKPRAKEDAQCAYSWEIAWAEFRMAPT